MSSILNAGGRMLKKIGGQSAFWEKAMVSKTVDTV
jgi:hypothetical protein